MEIGEVVVLGVATIIVLLVIYWLLLTRQK